MSHHFKNIEEYSEYINDFGNSELLQAVKNVNKGKYPDRYRLLKQEIESRNINQDPETRTVDEFKKYRTFWPRFWAGFVDGGIFLIVGLLYGYFEASIEGKVLSTLLFILISYSYLIYSVSLHGYFGQTLGKKVYDVKVLDVSESKMAFRQAFYRDVVPIVFVSLSVITEVYSKNTGLPKQALVGESSILLLLLAVVPLANSLWFLAEVITMLTNKKRRAVHDFIAKTVVVRI